MLADTDSIRNYWFCIIKFTDLQLPIPGRKATLVCLDSSQMNDSSQVFPVDRTREGIVILITALFFFSFQDIIVKMLSDRFNVLQIVFTRSVLALVFLCLIGFLTTGYSVLFARQPLLLICKGSVTFFAFLFYYLAIPSLPLADIVAIAFSSPILMTVLSVVLLKEYVGKRRWTAIILGFIGVLIVVGPSGNFANLGALLALGCAFSYAISSIMTRFIDKGDEPITIAIYSMLAFLIISGSLSLFIVSLGLSESPNPSIAFLFRNWIWPENREWVLLLIIGGIATIGFYCLGRAYLVAPASHVAPFEYTYIIWAVLLSYLFFNELPKLTTLIGVSILVVSSLYIWYRESRV